MASQRLKCPFPYFGGKSRVARLVWDRIGDCGNVIEPFCGSLAWLLARPHAPRIETVNDKDCYVSNFWRSTQHDPEKVAEYADGPVNEADLHARHRWLVLSDEATAFRERMCRDPEHYDCRIAGWWCWGLCCWIGGSWCSVPGETNAEIGCLQNRRPRANSEGSLGLPGVHAGLPNKMPRLASHAGRGGDGVHNENLADGHRPQLADAYSRGRGVHNDNHLSQQVPGMIGRGINSLPGGPSDGTCAQRRVWLLDWFGRLRDRLRTVRVCCGDWLRVCDSESVTTRLGVTGIFFDPPYSAEAGRDNGLYATEDSSVAHAVRAYCLERGNDPKMRLCVAGYAGEGHEQLEQHGWQVVHWAASGGYGNRSAKNNANAKKERLWFSPFCRNERTLFDHMEDDT